MEIPDYLILSDSNGTYDTTLGAFKYNIPPTWYSNQRSSVAAVSMVQFAYEQDNSGDVIGYITTSLASQNSRYSQEADSVLGVLTPTANATPTLTSFSYFDYNEPIKHLSPARPSQFNITFKQMDGTTVAPDEFMLVLKFEYANPQATSSRLLNEFTPQLPAVSGGIATYYPNNEISLTSLNRL